jgi:hypothetical protein
VLRRGKLDERLFVACGTSCLSVHHDVSGQIWEGGLYRDRSQRKRIQIMGKSMNSWAGAPLGELYYAGLFFPVGLGEEAFFRGFLQSSLSERFGPWGGWGSRKPDLWAGACAQRPCLRRSKRPRTLLTGWLALRHLAGCLHGLGLYAQRLFAE